jgi:hypothetical protein
MYAKTYAKMDILIDELNLYGVWSYEYEVYDKKRRITSWNTEDHVVCLVEKFYYIF